MAGNPGVLPNRERCFLGGNVMAWRRVLPSRGTVPLFGQKYPIALEFLSGFTLVFTVCLGHGIARRVTLSVFLKAG